MPPPYCSTTPVSLTSFPHFAISALVARAAPDGHTFGLFGSTLARNPAIRDDLPYDTLRDLQPVAHVASSPAVLVTSSAFPASSPGEFFALIKAHPKKYSYASPGVSTNGHRAMESLRLAMGPNPRAPTLAESGVPGFNEVEWWLLIAPSGVPKPVVDRVYRDIAHAVKDGDSSRAMIELGIEIFADPPAESARFLKAEMARVHQLSKSVRFTRLA